MKVETGAILNSEKFILGIYGLDFFIVMVVFFIFYVILSLKVFAIFLALLLILGFKTLRSFKRQGYLRRILVLILIKSVNNGKFIKRRTKISNY